MPTTSVRPLLDYAAFVWSPHTATNTSKLESIQRHAARYMVSDHKQFSSVSNMISVLNWKSLKQRRDIQSLCIFYKILNGLVDVLPPIYLISSQLATRGHNNKFVHISSRVDVYNGVASLDLMLGHTFYNRPCLATSMLVHTCIYI